MYPEFLVVWVSAFGGGDGYQTNQEPDFSYEKSH
jgi:hypothetical protein